MHPPNRYPDRWPSEQPAGSGAVPAAGAHLEQCSIWRRPSEHRVQMGAAICAFGADSSGAGPRRATKAFPEVQAPQRVNRLHCARRTQKPLGGGTPAGCHPERPTGGRKSPPQRDEASLQMSGRIWLRLPANRPRLRPLGRRIPRGGNWFGWSAPAGHDPPSAATPVPEAGDKGL